MVLPPHRLHTNLTSYAIFPANLCSEKVLAQRLAAVARQMSNASLQQLPEYHQRVKASLGPSPPSLCSHMQS